MECWWLVLVGGDGSLRVWVLVLDFALSDTGSKVGDRMVDLRFGDSLLPVVARLPMDRDSIALGC